MYASLAGQVAIVELLIDRFPDMVVLVNKSNVSCLMTAVNSGMPAVVKTILEKTKTRRNTHYTNSNNNNNNNRLLETLLGIRSATGMTALHFAARAGDLEIATLLVDAGAPVGIRDNAGKMAVDVAPSKSGCFKYLQEKYDAEQQSFFDAQQRLLAELGDDVGDGDRTNSHKSDKGPKGGKKKRAKNKNKNKTKTASPANVASSSATPGRSDDSGATPTESASGASNSKDGLTAIKERAASTPTESNTESESESNSEDESKFREEPSTDDNTTDPFYQRLLSRFPQAAALDLKPEYLLYDRLEELESRKFLPAYSFVLSYSSHVETPVFLTSLRQPRQNKQICET